jgi:hypothetical protein
MQGGGAFTRPERIASGQCWGLPADDGHGFELFAVLGTTDAVAVSGDSDGRLCAVDCERLLAEGEFLGHAPHGTTFSGWRET